MSQQEEASRASRESRDKKGNGDLHQELLSESGMRSEGDFNHVRKLCERTELPYPILCDWEQQLIDHEEAVRICTTCRERINVRLPGEEGARERALWLQGRAGGDHAQQLGGDHGEDVVSVPEPGWVRHNLQFQQAVETVVE